VPKEIIAQLQSVCRRVFLARNSAGKIRHKSLKSLW
jgi:hypothetical protein